MTGEKTEKNTTEKWANIWPVLLNERKWHCCEKWLLDSLKQVVSDIQSVSSCSSPGSSPSLQWFRSSSWWGQPGTAAGSALTSARTCTLQTWTRSTSWSTSPPPTLVQSSVDTSSLFNIKYCLQHSRYWLNSIIGFPFLIMGICYSLIYYQVNSVKHCLF